MSGKTKCAPLAGQTVSADFEDILERWLESRSHGEAREAFAALVRERSLTGFPLPSGDCGRWAEAFAASLPVSPEHPHVRRHGNLALKLCDSGEAASKEAGAQDCASTLLPAGLRPLRPVEIAGAFLVSRFVEGDSFDGRNREHVRAAAAHLARIHQTEISPAMASWLRRRGQCHYEGCALRNRLQEEVGNVRLAFGEPSAALLAEALPDVQAEVVLGHGDYQGPNMVFGTDRIFLTDWGDFGLCHPWYEVAHFLWFVEEDMEDIALESYLDVRRHPGNAEKGLEKGRLIDGIIRAGSVARMMLRRETEPVSALPPPW
ncbi:MAG: aminoglycoside phosphotransferase family protein [Chthoniobacterales bacterium]|nr:aminoglycoside phosphotransferase family protein [Chthoniobacterales bacterium]